MKLFPVPNDVPPVDAAYQSTTEPALAVALSVTVPVPHRDAGVVAVIVGIGFTVATTAVLDVDKHPLAFAST